MLEGTSNEPITKGENNPGLSAQPGENNAGPSLGQGENIPHYSGPSAPKKKKYEKKQEAVERRHQENLKMQERAIESFETCIEKLLKKL